MTPRQSRLWRAALLLATALMAVGCPVFPPLGGKTDGGTAPPGTRVDGAPTDAARANCSDDRDCPGGAFCYFELAACAQSTEGRNTLVAPGVCRPFPCGQVSCVGAPCASKDACGPAELCGAPGPAGYCAYAGRCAQVVTCPSDCKKVSPPYRQCDMCLCPSCTAP